MGSGQTPRRHKGTDGFASQSSYDDLRPWRCAACTLTKKSNSETHQLVIAVGFHSSSYKSCCER